MLQARFDNAMVSRRQAECQRLLGRQWLGFLEDHALLVRTAAFVGATPLWDPAACHRREFFDLAWTVARAGGGVLLEPNAVVTYRKVRPLLPSDLPLFVARRHDEPSALALAHAGPSKCHAPRAPAFCAHGHRRSPPRLAT